MLASDGKENGRGIRFRARVDPARTGDYMPEPLISFQLPSMAFTALSGSGT